MSINLYCGLQGSGKSYQVIAFVIVPAIARGRRVVTNIDGIDNEKVREYASKKHKVSLDDCGYVICVSTERISKAGFFPVDVPDLTIEFEVPDWIPRRELLFYMQSYTMHQSKEFNAHLFQLMLPELISIRQRGLDLGSCLIEAAESEWKGFKAKYFETRVPGVFCSLVQPEDTIVQGGDLVCLDEAWRYWGRDNKLNAEHMCFIRMHRHYVGVTGVACDIALMTQDIMGVHAFVKGVIQNTFRTHKARGLSDKLYTVSMWEGTRLTKQLMISSPSHRYDPEIFPLYKSYAGGSGKEVAADDRQKLLTTGLKIKILFIILAGCYAGYRLYLFFGHNMSGQTAVSTVPTASGVPAPKKESEFSSDWRIVGQLDVGGVKAVLLSGPGGIRVDPAGYYTGSGFSLAGVIDGKKVSRFSGVAPSDSSKKGPL